MELKLFRISALNLSKTFQRSNVEVASFFDSENADIMYNYAFDLKVAVFLVPLKYAKALRNNKKLGHFYKFKKACPDKNFLVQKEDMSREQRTYGSPNLEIKNEWR